MRYPVILIACLLLAALNGNSQVPPPPVDTTTDESDESRVFDRVEVEAVYPGGDQAWIRFIISKLNSEVPIKKKAPVGKYTVLIQFVVGKDGTVDSVEARTNHGYGMEAEAIRVIKLSPKWKPAIQNGRPVKAYRIQPITFSVEEEEKKNKRNRS